MLQKHLKDSVHKLKPAEEEKAIEMTFATLQKVSDVLLMSKDPANKGKTPITSIRQVLKGKILTAEEEDTGEEMEFVKGEEFLEALRIRDKSGLVLKVLGEYIDLKLITEILSRFGYVEDLPESKKHLNYAALTLQSKRIINRIN
jgi:hypothetical protein